MYSSQNSIPLDLQWLWSPKKNTPLEIQKNFYHAQIQFVLKYGIVLCGWVMGG